MTLAAARRGLRERLAAAGIASPDSEAARLLEALTGLTPSGQLLDGDRELSPEQLTALARWAERRERREPLQHILGRAPFYGLELLSGPEALIPRPESEMLVQLGLEAVAGIEAPRILDVGTGSGAIALALKHARPDAEVWGSDLSRPALGLARRNARQLVLDIRFVHADLLADPDIAAFAGRLDLLVSNPPYLPESDRDALQPEVAFDPPEALYSGRRGLDLFTRLEHSARALLRSGAVVLLELDVRNIAEAQRRARNWAAHSIERDLTGRERFLRLVR